MKFITFLQVLVMESNIISPAFCDNGGLLQFKKRLESFGDSHLH